MMNFRTLNFIKQVKTSFIYKIVSIFLSFLVIKYMLLYLGKELYGVWSLLLTLINFILFFDLGVTNGIKNKLSISLSNKKYQEAKEYISTGYAIIFAGSSVIYILFFLFSNFINWQNIFNINTLENHTLNKVLNTVFFFILLNFTLSISIAIYNAVQKTSFIVLNQLLSQLFSLIFLVFLINFTQKNILYLSFTYGFSLILSNIFLSIYFYKKNTQLIPGIQYIKIGKIKSILNLGLKFFILQLTIFFILNTDKIIITNLLGPSYVTSYDILFKYFSVITIIHSIINTPLWSMYTEAYEKNDYVWIENILKKMIKVIFIYFILATIMYFMAPIFIKIWVGNSVSLSNSNYILMIVLILILAWYSVFAYFTNGINKTKIQLILALTGAIVNIPLSIYFVKFYSLGLNGVLLGTIVSLSFFAIAGPIQAFKEIAFMKLKKSV